MSGNLPRQPLNFKTFMTILFLTALGVGYKSNKFLAILRQILPTVCIVAPMY